MTATAKALAQVYVSGGIWLSRTALADWGWRKLGDGDVGWVRVPHDMLVSDNQRHGPNPVRGGIGTTRRYRQAREAIRDQARQCWGQVLPFDGPVRVAHTLCAPARGRADLTAYVKIVHDALEGVAFGNDRQVVEVALRYGRTMGAPVLVCAIEPASDPFEESGHV